MMNGMIKRLSNRKWGNCSGGTSSDFRKRNNPLSLPTHFHQTINENRSFMWKWGSAVRGDDTNTDKLQIQLRYKNKLACDFRTDAYPRLIGDGLENQAGFFFFAAFFSRTSTASRIRIRVICDTVRSSCAASLSTRFRNSGSIRKVTESVCLGLGPGFMPPR